MRPRHLACLLALALVPASSAAASPVLVLDHGHVRTESDPFTPATPLPAQPARPPQARASYVTVRYVLARLLATGLINQARHDALLKTYTDAYFIRNQLTGTRRAELTGAINTLTSIAARNQLTFPRINVLFTQLDRNTQWWGLTARIPYSGERVRFGPSQVLYQYVPGQGLQFHPLANWGRVSGLLNGGYVNAGQRMLDELIPLASQRGTALTWEYFFYFGGGASPWTSGLSQGTALVAIMRDYAITQDPNLLLMADSALRLYELSAPLGVRVRSRYGAHYAEYTFAPTYRIINGFIQALNGLWDVAAIGHSSRALGLFRTGELDARRSLPYFDTGRWSRYSNRGEVSSLGYHVLLSGFLSGLCRRIHYYAYCSKAARFAYYTRRYGGPPLVRR